MRHIDALAKLLIIVFAAGVAAAHAEPGAPGRRNVAVLLYEGVELLDFAGPTEVFTAAGDFRAFRVYTVAATHQPVLSQGVIKVTPDYSIADAPLPDILVLPGGSSGVVTRNAAVMAWVDKVMKRNSALSMSVCTGAFILAQLGYLDGRAATTHWASLQALRDNFPKISVKSDVRYVDSGRVVTTAGVSAGIDGALHVVQRLLGDEAARDTARYMQYDYWNPAAATASTR